ncbi:alkaline phosphatase D family protein [Planctopirus ephydatiae]
MNYNKFMLGKNGRASGPETATEEDKRLGFPSFESMLKLNPDFFIGTGDIVYYDHPLRVAKTVPQLRLCWHEQFRFPRLIEFFRRVPTYWSKDDHDFRFNESDNTSDELPLPKTGIDIFREQLPITAPGVDKRTYRTHRVGKHLQIWLTEGRDYRSPNGMADGPEKSLWGTEQREWLKTTLKASDAKWKIIISPTPMVGPDDKKKIDNHADISGFRHEADAFFAWLKESKIDNLKLVCGDRHWQYHSIHPSGIEEFACGALNDENSRMGVAPGAKNGSDPEARIKQPFTSATPLGGFLQITAAEQLTLEHFDSRGNSLNRVTR